MYNYAPYPSSQNIPPPYINSSLQFSTVIPETQEKRPKKKHHRIRNFFVAMGVLLLLGGIGVAFLLYTNPTAFDTLDFTSLSVSNDYGNITVHFDPHATKATIQNFRSLTSPGVIDVTTDAQGYPVITGHEADAASAHDILMTIPPPSLPGGGYYASTSFYSFNITHQGNITFDNMTGIFCAYTPDGNIVANGIAMHTQIHPPLGGTATTSASTGSNTCTSPDTKFASIVSDKGNVSVQGSFVAPPPGVMSPQDTGFIQAGAGNISLTFAPATTLMLGVTAQQFTDSYDTIPQTLKAACPPPSAVPCSTGLISLGTTPIQILTVTAPTGSVALAHS